MTHVAILITSFSHSLHTKLIQPYRPTVVQQLPLPSNTIDHSLNSSSVHFSTTFAEYQQLHRRQHFWHGTTLDYGLCTEWLPDHHDLKKKKKITIWARREKENSRQIVIAGPKNRIITTKFEIQKGQVYRRPEEEPDTRPTLRYIWPSVSPAQQTFEKKSSLEKKTVLTTNNRRWQ